jgi:hypothetical protein
MASNSRSARRSLRPNYWRRFVLASVSGAAVILGVPLLASSGNALTAAGSAPSQDLSVPLHGFDNIPSTTICYPDSTTTTVGDLGIINHLRPHYLVADCAPETPTNLKVTRRGATVTGTWDRMPGSWFLCTLTYGAQPSGVTVRTADRTCTFSGLNPRGAYGINLIALNQFGSSPLAFAKAPNPVVVTITCVKGAVVRHVVGVSPRCPAGFHRR